MNLRKDRVLALLLPVLTLATISARDCCAGWMVLPPTDERRSIPADVPSDAKPIERGSVWPNDSKYRWLIGDLVIPEQIDGKKTAGQPVGMQIDCGDGGEVWLDGKLQGRFDNDHPALTVISESAEPGKKVRIGILSYAKVQGGDHFSKADWVVLDPVSAKEPLLLTIDAGAAGTAVPLGIVGLSQGGGMCDYEDATARKLNEGGFKWFRMDNVFTSVVKRGANGKLAYDFSDMDKRLDFMRVIGAEPILAASYMPQVFDAVPDGERHSAPADYSQWEDLCERAAGHARERGTPVPDWEVWNETNAGWLKPGPADTGSEEFKKLYREASGKEPTDKETVRRLEAYCKLYRATANGVRRGDPAARIGGPALASGPFDDSSQGGPGVHGRTFARGLMLWCDQQKLPLDFLSWHEYFHGASVIADEAREFRKLAGDFPRLGDASKPLVISEWNEAWWPDRPHDNEIGAAWCADCITRCFIPQHVDRPCLFYVKQNDDNFRGDWSILMKDNRPKPTFNVAKIFNSLSGTWLTVKGSDDEVSCVGAWDAKQNRLCVILVNFQAKFAMRRHVKIHINSLPAPIREGSWREWTIDATHSNAWNDPAAAELQQTGKSDVNGKDFDRTIEPNSVMMLEIVPPKG